MKKNVDLLPFSYYLEQILSRDLYNVFSDFLTICVCCLSLGKKENEYLKVIKKYSKAEVDLFAQAFASMVNDADNNWKGFKDPFGAYFEEHFSSKFKGQFFTPEPISDLMSKMAGQSTDRKIFDCCCGSGRLLLSHAKTNNRDEHFYVGWDVSYVCCQMALINLCLNSMRGEIVWGDSLNLKVWRKWIIVVDKVLKLPFIYEVEEGNKNNEPEDAEFIEVKPEIPAIKPAETPENEDIGYVIFE